MRQDPPGAGPTGRAFLGIQPMVSKQGFPGVAQLLPKPYVRVAVRGLGWGLVGMGNQPPELLVVLL